MPPVFTGFCDPILRGGDFTISSSVVPQTIGGNREKLINDSRDGLPFCGCRGPNDPRQLLGVVRKWSFRGVIRIKQPAIDRIFHKRQMPGVALIIADVVVVKIHRAPFSPLHFRHSS
jgi:hypothetical protein